MELADQISIRPRFARAANVERDLSSEAIEGYILTGRALDVLARIGGGLRTPSSGRALAITGPHGGGKSSLGVFLSALFADRDSSEYRAASRILRRADPAVAEMFTRGLDTFDPTGHGVVRAFATAAHEPVAVTIARALLAGARRTLGDSQVVVPTMFADENNARDLSVREITDVVAKLCAVRPVALVIDEFGKNLEAFASFGHQGDPYLLQWLAEAAQGDSGLPLLIVTMQHLAFDEYTHGTSQVRRREWAKVQGRFMDVPFVETAREAQRLIATSIEVKPGPLQHAIYSWYQDHADEFATAGLRELWGSASACYPLHPLTVATLPELCARYGQNERTLFSYIAGNEPLAIPAFLATTSWRDGGRLPFAGLDRVYDYFLDSSGTMISASPTVSRWLEIETRIRDTSGLSREQLQVLKSIGVLNLVSSSGTLRASHRVLALACTDVGSASFSSESLTQVLSSLELAGLITYRDFADEYRIWQGSDFDLEGAVAAARTACSSRSLADLLNDAAPLDPAVAGRHSQSTGVLRIFEQRFSDLAGEDLTPPGPDDPWDGKVLYATVAEFRAPSYIDEREKPVVVAIPEATDAVRTVAVEAAALRMALHSAGADTSDWVARRELIERAADTDKTLRQAIASTWGSSNSGWHLLGHRKELPVREGVSAALSRAADLAYHSTPRIANEMIARRELTSQGAKARRMLLEAFLANPAQEKFGIVGYGPDRAIYEALYRSTGIHRLDKATGRWRIDQPSAKDWARVWSEVISAFDESRNGRLSLRAVSARLKRPPIGLKDGALPILLVTALVMHADEVALYEHGSLLLSLDDAVAERLARNPGNFAIKNTGTGSGCRKIVVEAIAGRFGIATLTGRLTFLQVARALYRELQSLPPFSRRTVRYVSREAAAVRQAFISASEPDVLIFETLPNILGHRTFSVDETITDADANSFAMDFGRAIGELRDAYPSLLRDLWTELAEATAAWGDPSVTRRLLAAQAASLEGRILEPRLGAFVAALSRELDGDAWIENVAMVVVGGQSPRSWSDSVADRFSLLVADLGGALRRVQALLFDRLAASEDGFRSRRVTVTRPDGQEASQVLTLSDRDRDIVSEHLAPVMTALADIFGSRAAACQTMLAHLVSNNLEDPGIAQPESARLAVGGN